jgi:hypothetical protein
VTVYALAGGTGIVARSGCVTLLAVMHGTFTYGDSGTTPQAGDQTDDAPAQPTPAIPAGEANRRRPGAFTHGTK